MFPRKRCRWEVTSECVCEFRRKKAVFSKKEKKESALNYFGVRFGFVVLGVSLIKNHKWNRIEYGMKI